MLRTLKHQHICRLQIVVEDAQGMRGRHNPGQLCCQRNPFAETEPHKASVCAHSSRFTPPYTLSMTYGDSSKLQSSTRTKPRVSARAPPRKRDSVTSRCSARRRTLSAANLKRAPGGFLHARPATRRQVEPYPAGATLSSVAAAGLLLPPPVERAAAALQHCPGGASGRAPPSDSRCSAHSG